MKKTDTARFFKKVPKIPIFRVFRLKMGFFKVFQSFLKIGSNDFSVFLSKVSAQYRLTTGENHMFRKSLNFAPGGQKGPKNHRKSDPENPKIRIFFDFFFTQNHSIRKKKQ